MARRGILLCCSIGRLLRSASSWSCRDPPGPGTIGFDKSTRLDENTCLALSRGPVSSSQTIRGRIQKPRGFLGFVLAFSIAGWTQAPVEQTRLAQADRAPIEAETGLLQY